MLDAVWMKDRTMAKTIIKNNNAFIKRMAQYLKYGSRDFIKNVRWLQGQIAILFPGENISTSTIRSWFTQGKYPKRKNIEMIAKIYGISPDELGAPLDNSAKSVMNSEAMIIVDEAIQKIIPIFREKYINLDNLPEIKKEIIKNVLFVKDLERLSIVKRASEIVLEEDKDIKEEHNH